MNTPNATQLMMDIELLLSTSSAKKLEGWCTTYKAQHLAAMILALRPSVTVEIGVFGGRSAIPMAMAHAFNEHGSVIAIDPWAKSASLDGLTGEDKAWWDKIDHELIYQQFLRAGNRSIALGFLKVIRAESDTAILGDQVPEVIDVLHIDGNHEGQAVRDVTNYVPRVRAGGIIIMDDIDWAAPAVEAAKKIGLKFLYNLDTGAVFQR